MQLLHLLIPVLPDPSLDIEVQCSRVGSTRTPSPFSEEFRLRIISVLLGHSNSPNTPMQVAGWRLIGSEPRVGSCLFFYVPTNCHRGTAAYRSCSLR
jgi:hypothetical protein